MSTTSTTTTIKHIFCLLQVALAGHFVRDKRWSELYRATEGSLEHISPSLPPQPLTAKCFFVLSRKKGKSCQWLRESLLILPPLKMLIISRHWRHTRIIFASPPPFLANIELCPFLGPSLTVSSGQWPLTYCRTHSHLHTFTTKPVVVAH